MRLYLVALCACAFLLSGCAQKEFTQNAPELPQVKDDTPKRQEIIKTALKYQGKPNGGDCSGFVSLVNKESTQPFFSTAELNDYFEDARRSLAIYNLLEDQKRLYHEKPKEGDLIFFANTIKKYAKAKKSVDNITHIGIITKIDPDETVHFIHHTKGKNLISQMNLNYPTVMMNDTKVVNSYMEKCPKDEGHKCLAPAYFSAYGSIK
ncbi:NlpC/P60 family protein [Sulfurospirillum halorespirans]|uniref:NlpC/P60 domain-containing protein n=1 Tax=Sulfurospirillum halorespirans DSM 13726 TaxID=1193502 RepID=A0A1D7TKR0_9BACT|nr:NlpC/P60 family protein [Sulfurospirillum halorespirans]AOO65583.1 hypothetical protein SHALO_1812 [Sulfurospirillum halorespirans DSM 13726]